MNAALLLVVLADVTVGSKAFTESVILGEATTQLLVAQGVGATHRRQLGGTQVLWRALKAGDIDVYPEYTGTLTEEVFAGRTGELAALLAAEGVVLGPRLGFNDTYAIGMKEETAARLGIRRLSELAAHPGLRLGFSNEFLARGDGWPALRAAYALPQRDVRGLDHDLAYRALADGAIAATDLYSTDAEIRHYGLRVLEDDRGHFPRYDAVLVHRADLPPEAARAIARLAGTIDEPRMIAMNARAKLERVPEAQVAADFLAAAGLGAGGRVEVASRAARVWATTREHLALVALSLIAAVVVALPLGVLAARRPRAGAAILGAASVIQTIPSLALLVFLIPLLGIGAKPAIVALFLYSLLPIVRNTYAGLHDVPASLLEAADALGLAPRARLRILELPLAARAILAGVKTSAVINVGTATLGALVGAGGLGQPILTGIRLDDVGLILEGAVPAAALALIAQGAFDLAERWLVPRALRPARGLQFPGA